MTQASALNGMRSMGDFEARWQDDENMEGHGSILAHQSVAHVYPEAELQVEFVEHTEAYWVFAELPHVQQDDITLRVDGDVLSIIGEWPEDASAAQRMRPQRAFARQFKLDTPVQADAVAMSYTDGMLTVCVPKLAVSPAHALV